MSDKYVDTLRQIQRLVNDALSAATSGKPPKKAPASAKPVAVSTGSISFGMNVLAFMKKYARGLSGPQKFTLLVAYIAKGDVSAQVPSLVIQGQWNKMKTMLGQPNPVHGNRAKANGWVEPVKTGTWKLTDTWKEAVNG